MASFWDGSHGLGVKRMAKVQSLAQPETPMRLRGTIALIASPALWDGMSGTVVVANTDGPFNYLSSGNG